MFGQEVLSGIFSGLGLNICNYIIPSTVLQYIYI